MELRYESWKTISDMEALPEGTGAELINGVIYDMAAPTVAHQELVSFLHGTIWNYIFTRGGTCKVFTAPFDVQLDKDDYTLVQPDISVICDKDKLSNGKRCIGAPDWIVEIVSPSTDTRDYKTKLLKYRAAGVRAYWIVDPLDKRIVIYSFESGAFQILPLQCKVKAEIFPDLEVDFAALDFSGLDT